MGKAEEAIRSMVAATVRREVRETMSSLSKEVRELRRSLSALEKRIASLETAVARAPAYGGRLPRLQVSDKELRRSRVTPATIKKLRARQGITQAQLAAIIGVTGPAVAQWETGTSEPSEENRRVLVALRKASQRDIERLLAAKGMSLGRGRAGRTK